MTDGHVMVEVLELDGSVRTGLTAAACSESPCSEDGRGGVEQRLAEGADAAGAAGARRAAAAVRDAGCAAEAEDMCIDPASAATITRVLAYSARTSPLDCNVYLEWLSLCGSC